MLDIKKLDQLFNKVLKNNKNKLENNKDFPLSLKINGTNYLLTIFYYRTLPGYYNIYYLNLMEGYRRDKISTLLNPLGFNDNEVIFNNIKRKSKKQLVKAEDFKNWYRPFKKALRKLLKHQLDPLWH